MLNDTKDLKPLFDNVLLKVGDNKKEIDGIIIPEANSKDSNREGEVVAVGPGKYDENGKWSTPVVQVGDVVLFSGHNDGLKITENKITYIICGQEYILGKYEKSKVKLEVK